MLRHKAPARRRRFGDPHKRGSCGTKLNRHDRRLVRGLAEQDVLGASVGVGITSTGKVSKAGWQQIHPAVGYTLETTSTRGGSDRTWLGENDHLAVNTSNLAARTTRLLQQCRGEWGGGRDAGDSVRGRWRR